MKSMNISLPEPLKERINSADPEWCERLIERAFSVESLSELKIED